MKIDTRSVEERVAAVQDMAMRQVRYVTVRQATVGVMAMMKIDTRTAVERVDTRTAVERVLALRSMSAMRDRPVTMYEAKIGVYARMSAHAWAHENYHRIHGVRPPTIVEFCGACVVTPWNLIP